MLLTFRESIDDRSDSSLADSFSAVITRSGESLFAILVDTSNVDGRTFRVGATVDSVCLRVNGEILRNVHSIRRVDVSVLLLVDSQSKNTTVLDDDSTVLLGEVAGSGHLGSKSKHGLLLTRERISKDFHYASHDFAFFRGRSVYVSIVYIEGQTKSNLVVGENFSKGRIFLACSEVTLQVYW